MERVQSVAGHREDSGPAACVACEAPLEASRCGHCGAAVAPGGYRVQRLVSQSVHGRVYLAVDREGRRVALKELLFALVPGVEQLEAFEREAAVLRSLSHPDIPRFLASFQEGRGVGTRLYLAQEFLEGESLLQRIERQRLDEDEAWTLAAQVLGTLGALHQRTPALIHRDIKPANLILRPDGRVALVDFGAARHLARDVTHGSTLVGTFGYMPPEQLGGTVEPSSDLYALGATLVHALSGRMPSDLLDEGMALSFEKHVRGSDALRAFLRRLLAPKRSERFASAADALSALRAARAVPVAQAEKTPAAAQRTLDGEPAVPSIQPRRSDAASAVGEPPAARHGVAAARSGAASAVQANPSARHGAAEDSGVAASGRETSAAPHGAAEDSGVDSTVQETPAEQQAVAPSAFSKRRVLRWALAGIALGGILAGALLASGALGSRSEVVVMQDPSGWQAPPQAQPHPASPGPVPGGGSHRNFRTPWPGAK